MIRGFVTSHEDVAAALDRLSRDGRPVTAAEVAAELTVSVSTARRFLNAMARDRGGDRWVTAERTASTLLYQLTPVGLRAVAEHDVY